MKSIEINDLVERSPLNCDELARFAGGEKQTKEQKELVKSAKKTLLDVSMAVAGGLAEDSDDGMGGAVVTDSDGYSYVLI
jgi:hypothetical protein